MRIPTPQDVIQAARRIAGKAVRTPLLRSDAADRELGFQLTLKAEHLQHGRAFKFRGATNAVACALESNPSAFDAVATHSSGNHALALTLAAAACNLSAHIVMPANSPQHKIDAVRHAGADITLCQPTLDSREQTLQAIIRETGARFIHPYNDPDVIAGQGTCVLEWLSQQSPPPQIIIAPIGGGGLLAGSTLAATTADHPVTILGAEPAAADDAARSLETGVLTRINQSDTIADGLRTSLGPLPFEILKAARIKIARVDEQDILPTVHWVADRFAHPIEPSAAVAVALMLHRKKELTGKRIGILLSGGNTPGFPGE